MIPAGLRSFQRPVAFALALLLAGCASSPPPSVAGSSTPVPTSTSTATATPASVATPTATASVAPTQPAPTPTPGNVTPSSLATSLIGPLRAALDEQRTSLAIPGMSAAIIFPDGSVWSASSGLAQVDPARRATPFTPFVVGSITKTFVTAAIMQLAEEGALSLDDPLSDWLPDYPRADQITLRHLLSHTSGVFNLFDSPNYTRLVVRSGKGKSWTPQQILDNFVEAPYFAPGTGFHYSNTGFVLLGMVIEAQTGKPLGTVLRERFFEPLHLGATYFEGDGPPPWYSARGYVPSGGVNKPVSDGSNYRPTKSEATVVWAAGAIVSSARDICRWGRALYGGDVVSADSLADMTDYNYSPYALDTYGLGTRTRLFGSQRMFGHTGALRGFNAALWHLPALDLTVVVLTNRTRIDANKIIDALLAVAVPAIE